MNLFREIVQDFPHKRFILLFSYGDKTPKAFLSRVYALGWFLVGIVMMSLIIGVITSSLTATVVTEMTPVRHGMRVSPLLGELFSKLSENNVIA